MNKVKIQNDNLERGKQQLEQQLNTLHGELQKQQDVMKRLGMLCRLINCSNATHPLYTPPIPQGQVSVKWLSVTGRTCDVTRWTLSGIDGVDNGVATPLLMIN